MIHVDFKMLVSQAGSEDGARILFQRLLAALVRLTYKDAREIRPAPGDWGIDVLVGKLTDACLVWQAKYFFNGIGDSQKGQIRDSFNSLMINSKEKGFKVNIWTLCVPCSLSAEETKWWEGWKGRSQRKYKLKIKLEDETALRTKLESPDAEHLKIGYFGPNPTILHYFLDAMKKEPEKDIKELPDPELYGDATFIKKLEAAGTREFTSAKTQFFNAELLTQEVLDKDDQAEISSIRSLREKLRSIWETRYNEAYSTQDDDQFPALYPRVMMAVERNDQGSLKTNSVNASLLHKQGMIHQLADKCEVGWTRNYKEDFNID